MTTILIELDEETNKKVKQYMLDTKITDKRKAIVDIVVKRLR